VLRHGNNDPRWKVNDYGITPDAASRMFDPFHPDCEPMPCDDPAAHKKMHNAAGMRGSAHWHDNGDTSHVENPHWRQYLLLNEKGEVPLDRDKSVELARLHSPEYQSTVENLYLSAMKVSQERFAFDVQFFGGDSVLYKNVGSARSGSGASWTQKANIGAERTLATGGTWVVDLANSITWTLTGQGSWRAESLINVGVTQPLLRGASRKVVLEKLTQTERDFLAELRKMVLFQQGHYTRIVTGTPPQNVGVSFRGGGGFYRLLANQIQIQNQRQNIIGLEENLDRFVEMFEAGQVSDVYQVEETRQSLLMAQSRLLDQTNRYQASVEAYVSSLGLPPDLKVSISDPLLEQFQFTSPSLTVLMEDIADFLALIRKKDRPLPEEFRDNIKNVVRRAEGEIAILEQDLQALRKSMPERRASLKSLETFLVERIREGDRVSPIIYDANFFESRVVKLQRGDIPKNLSRLRATFTLIDLIVNTEESDLREMIRNRSFDPAVMDALELLQINVDAMTSADAELLLRRQQELESMIEQLQALQDAQRTDDSSLPLQEELALRKAQRIENLRIIADLRQKDEYRDWIRRVLSVFQYELVSLSLMQTRTRLDAMTLVPIAVTPEEAFRIASENRLDWMNRKAQLVDTWRQIDVTAHQLRGVLDLTFDGALGTADRNGVNFSKNNSALSVGLKWDSPLNRYAEMMNYRRSQVEYQKARREYYTYVDTVQSDLRDTLRNVQMRQIEFEINRNAVLVDTIRVDVMQLRMEQPPQRGGRIDTNTAQQLINALNGLMNSQNNLLGTWVEYQTQRMLLDLYMGTMALDAQGRWIEPDVKSSAKGLITVQPPELAPEIPVPILQVPAPQAPRLNRRYVE